MPITQNEFIINTAANIPHAPNLDGMDIPARMSAMKPIQNVTKATLNKGIWAPQAHATIIHDVARVTHAKTLLYTNSVNPCVAVYIWMQANGKNLLALAHFDSGSLDGSRGPIEKVMQSLIDLCADRLGERMARMYVQSMYGAGPNASSQTIRERVRDVALQSGATMALGNPWQIADRSYRCSSSALACGMKNGKHYFLNEGGLNPNAAEQYQQNMNLQEQGLITIAKLDIGLTQPNADYRTSGTGYS